MGVPGAAKIGAYTAAAHRTQEDHLALVRVEHLMPRIGVKGTMLQQHARKQASRGIVLDGEAPPLPDQRGTAIGSYHQARVRLLDTSLVFKYHRWHAPRSHLPHARPPAHLGPSLGRGGEEHLLHLWMVKAEQGGVVRRGRWKVAVIDAVGAQIGIPPAHFDPTRLAQPLVDAQRAPRAPPRHACLRRAHGPGSVAPAPAPAPV